MAARCNGLISTTDYPPRTTDPEGFTNMPAKDTNAVIPVRNPDYNPNAPQKAARQRRNNISLNSERMAHR